MEAILRISRIAILMSTSKNATPFLLLLMSTPQENWRRGKNRFCLEARGIRRRGKGWEAEGRNDPNIVCTYE
jgi:hypothetical protein